jgi:hypothetical protein
VSSPHIFLVPQGCLRIQGYLLLRLGVVGVSKNLVYSLAGWHFVSLLQETHGPETMCRTLCWRQLVPKNLSQR